MKHSISIRIDSVLYGLIEESGKTKTEAIEQALKLFFQVDQDTRERHDFKGRLLSCLCDTEVIQAVRQCITESRANVSQCTTSAAQSSIDGKATVRQCIAEATKPTTHTETPKDKNIQDHDKKASFMIVHNHVTSYQAQGLTLRQACTKAGIP